MVGIRDLFSDPGITNNQLSPTQRSVILFLYETLRRLFLQDLGEYRDTPLPSQFIRRRQHCFYGADMVSIVRDFIVFTTPTLRLVSKLIRVPKSHFSHGKNAVSGRSQRKPHYITFYGMPMNISLGTRPSKLQGTSIRSQSI